MMSSLTRRAALFLAAAFAAVAPIPVGAQEGPFDGRTAFALPASAGPELPLDGATAFAITAEDKPTRLQKLQQLTFDRRPSAILKLWATPTGPPADEPQAVEGPATPAEPVAAAPAEVLTKATRLSTTTTVISGTRINSARSAARAAMIAQLQAGRPELAARLASEMGETAPAASPEAPKAPAVDPFDLLTQRFQRLVTGGEWDEVKRLLKSLPVEEGDAGYKQLVTALVAGPPMDPNNPPTTQAAMMYPEKNLITNEDFLAIAGLNPKPHEKGTVEALGQLLRAAVDGGSVIEDALSRLRKRLNDPEAPPTLTRREVARLLLSANFPVEAGEFLPKLAEIERTKDREALNLLARHLLAKHAKDKKAVDLEAAWQATQAILAIREARPDKDATTENDEALRRAVELAPKVREELGLAWLERSFTDRPQRGMEIIAAIGTDAAQGLVKRSHDVEYRQQSLLLMKHAVAALLKASPDRAEAWKPTLTVLGSAWFKEADFSRQYDQSTGRGPSLNRDVYGNIYYSPYMYQQYGQMQDPNIPMAVPTGKILEARPEGGWLDRIDRGIQPKLSATLAQLHLKMNEEDEAFPLIERLAPALPDVARDLVREFLEVWIKNHDPNGARSWSDNYIYFFGFEERLQGIPLTRSKQERNIVELSDLVARIKKLPIGEMDEKLLARAFTTCHSSAEVYQLESIERVFGPMGGLEPGTLASLVDQMRSNLAGVWRTPQAQQEKKTNRKQKDIEAEVVRGYEVARAVIDKALADHPDRYKLVLAKATLMHDENTYRQTLAKTAEFVPKRNAAFEMFARAADLYAKKVAELPEDEQTTEVYEYWMYAGLGDCELGAIDEEKPSDPKQFERVKAALEALPGEVGENHMEKFASQLFTRMSSVKPVVKFRYLKAGFLIVGDNEAAYEAKKVYDYYADLVTEIKLETAIDGPEEVGSGTPFGVFVNLRHTREIERESGGFGRYLQNQNAGGRYYYNYGRPTTDYRDKFTETVKNAFNEHFEVLSVTFQSEDVHSRADPRQYGWRITPYAYVLLKARGPEVDKLPPVRLDLDFMDTSGYVVLPVESSSLALDARARESRPYGNLKLTETLDERQSADGKLILEVKGVARGLVPELGDLVELPSPEFEVVKEEDQGLSVVEWDKDSDTPTIVSERTWLVTYHAEPGLPKPPKSFTFARPLVDTKEVAYQRYQDADLAVAGPVIDLESKYGRPSRAGWWLGGAMALLAVVAAVAAVMLRRGPAPVERGRFALPEPVTPFTVLGLLRDIERNDGLAEPQRRDLSASIRRIEDHYFVRPNPEAPDLRGIAEGWIATARPAS